ncbi:MAG TPA: S8 family serine peptidase [Candidatus Acidoferrum sp.]|nr:S8 family serine peptidase [Candidatus Acidoferrum sp.]
MKPILKRYFFAILTFAVFCGGAQAQNLNTIGVTLLRAVDTNLNGTGIRVGQPEAAEDTNGVFWEINPSTVMEPASLFTYYSNNVVTNTYPNSLGSESGHAFQVASFFYMQATGVATNVAHVDTAEADDYFNDFIANDRAFALGVTDAVVNQSFTFGPLDTNTQEMVDSAYDDYSMQFRTLFVSAACNFSIFPRVCAPGTSYNCISVGAFGGDSSVGPTIDNGRCKPDIAAPAPETSFSTPQVAGAAAILMQAGRRGDGGSDTNSAANVITVKALLLNGAVKPADWTNVAPSPLDYRYGAGVLNVFNSYEQLAFGKHGYSFSTNIPLETAHPPVATAVSVPVLSGWDFNTNTSSSSEDAVKHYFFNVTNASRAGTFSLTTTLVWNRHQSKTNINDLALYLYNAANSNLVAASTSVVDNVQHVFVPQLAQGRYDLQVWKAGGAGIVSNSEPYALAWQIFSDTLSITSSQTNVCLSWPVYPAGFALASTASLNAPVTWSTNNIPAPLVTNNENVVWVSATNSAQFFRLQTPDF